MPALVAKGLYVLFNSEEALLIDSMDNVRDIVSAPKQEGRIVLRGVTVFT